MKREAELQKGVSAKDLQLAEEITIGAMPFKIRFNSLGWFPLWIRDNYHLLEPFYELLHNRQFLFEAFLEGEVTREIWRSSIRTITSESRNDSRRPGFEGTSRSKYSAIEEVFQQPQFVANYFSRVAKGCAVRRRWF